MVRDLINRLGGDIVLAILASSLFASIAIGREGRGAWSWFAGEIKVMIFWHSQNFT